jgi:hypothetical protein
LPSLRWPTSNLPTMLYWGGWRSLSSWQCRITSIYFSRC